MALPQGLNFRQTAGYVTDGSNEDYEIYATTGGLGAGYPRTTPQGNTVGWENVSTDSGYTRNRNSGNDRRIAGRSGPNLTICAYRIDLPSAGSYSLRLAVGDGAYTSAVAFEVRDTSSVLMSTTGSTSAGNTFKDATNTQYSAANWPASNTAATLSFSTTIFRLAPTTAGSAVAHIYIASAGPAPITRTPAAATATLAGQAPTITVSAGGVRNPGAGAAILAGLAPTLVRTQHSIVLPAAASLSATGRAPTATRTGSFVTEPFINDTGTVLANETAHFSYFPLGRVGALNGIAPYESSLQTDANGVLTIPGRPVGAGMVAAAIRHTDATDDDVFYQAGNAA